MITNIGLNNAAGWNIETRQRPESLPAGLVEELKKSGQANPVSDPHGIDGAGASTKASFTNFIDQAVHEVDGKMHAAEVEQTKVLTGETNNLHQAMISMQEASVAFSLMVEVRNKLVDSYQELMRMQV